jgi:hypothetical protein
MAPKCKIVDIEELAKLMLRYWGIGPELTSDEREILMFSLSLENAALGGEIDKRAKEALKKHQAP